VPYYSWKITHGKHHHSTGHMSKDQVFVPKIRESNPGKGEGHHDIHEDSNEAPIVSLMHIAGMLLGGWPAYLIFNVSGQKYQEWTR